MRAAGLRRPVEETFEFSKDSFGLDHCQARLHTAIVRHTVWHQPRPDDDDTHWRNWRRRHQARARWFHQRTRLHREYALVS